MRKQKNTRNVLSKKASNQNIMISYASSHLLSDSAGDKSEKINVAISISSKKQQSNMQVMVDRAATDLAEEQMNETGNKFNVMSSRYADKIANSD